MALMNGSLLLREVLLVVGVAKSIATVVPPVVASGSGRDGMMVSGGGVVVSGGGVVVSGGGVVVMVSGGQVPLL